MIDVKIVIDTVVAVADTFFDTSPDGSVGVPFLIAEDVEIHIERYAYVMLAVLQFSGTGPYKVADGVIFLVIAGNPFHEKRIVDTYSDFQPFYDTEFDSHTETHRQIVIIGVFVFHERCRSRDFETSL